jgi:hypothetical protein
MGGWNSSTGLWARIEAGLKVLTNVGVFGYAEVTQSTGLSAGTGIRVTF